MQERAKKVTNEISVRFTLEQREAIEKRVLGNGHVLSYYVRDLVIADLKAHGLLTSIEDGFRKLKTFSNAAKFAIHYESEGKA
jgi:hypothetical protein